MEIVDWKPKTKVVGKTPRSVGSCSQQTADEAEPETISLENLSPRLRAEEEQQQPWLLSENPASWVSAARMHWRGRLRYGSGPAKAVALNLAAVHDWDNLKNPDGFTHFMMANASFEASEADDVLVLSWVPDPWIPVDKSTVLGEEEGKPCRWTVEADVLPKMEDGTASRDLGLWRFCNGVYGDGDRWVRLTGFDVDPMFCVGAIRKHAPNDRVAQWLSSQPTGTVAERACMVSNGVEAVMNPSRNLCFYFRVRDDGSKRRELGQIDMLLRSNDLYNTDVLDPVDGPEGSAQENPPIQKTDIVFSEYRRSKPKPKKKRNKKQNRQSPFG